MDLNSLNLLVKEVDINQPEIGELQSNFLFAASHCLNKVSSNALRSHINIHCGDICQRYKYTFTKNKKPSSIFCQYCLTLWKYGNFTLKVRPAAKIGRKMKKILRRKDASKKLSPIQEKLADAIHLGNIVIITCKVCQKSTLFKVRRELLPIRQLLPQTALDAPTDNCNESGKGKKKKKKKKKKDLFSGLNSEAVQQLHSYTENKNNLLWNNDNNIVIDHDDYETEKNIRQQKKISKQCKTAKRNWESDLLPDILSPKIRKSGKFSQKKDFIKANPLPITPLGEPSTSSFSSNRQSSEDFIPLSNNEKSSHKKGVRKNGVKKHQSLPLKSSLKKKQNQFINPFSNAGLRIMEKNKNKKLNSWKKLIAQEEKNPAKGSSLQDFLLTL